MAFLAGGVAACGGTQRPVSDPRPEPGAVVSTLFDAGSVYGAMGLLVAGPPLPFVATLDYVADATPDSTLAVFGLSLSNHVLTFQRDGNVFTAHYHVEIIFRADTGAVRQFASDETVRVQSFQETQRGDESVIYQQFIGVPPGIYKVMVTVRDRSGPAASHQDRTDTVPRFAGQGTSAPLAVYRGTGRARASDVPKLLVNPRATVAYGADTLRFYLEAYGERPGARWLARALDLGGHEIWHDTVALAGTQELSSGVAQLAPGVLPVGAGRFEIGRVGSAATHTAPFLVSFSDQWAITNYDQMISLLRYFERQDWVDKLRHAIPDQRPAVWQQFYKATDPVELTPENEALDGYFRRVQIANQRFREAGEPGWLTDRGEVFITLGEPDDVFDFTSDVSRSGIRGVRWTYREQRLTLFFQDNTGFGRFRLTPLSRAEFQRIVAQRRRQ
jgi:GWxTD domain-containing protein